MKKKTIGRLAAVSLAAMTAIPSVAIVASADTATALQTDGTYAYGYVFPLTVTEKTETGLESTNTLYFVSEEARAAYAENNAGTEKDKVYITSQYNAGTKIYVGEDGYIVSSSSDAKETYIVKSTTTSGSTSTSTSSGTTIYYPYATSYVYVGANGYYPNLASLYAAGDTLLTQYKSSTTWSSTNCYFDTSTGQYVTYAYAINNSSDCVLIKGYNSSYDSTSSTSTYGRYLVNGRYYPTYAEALSAAGSSYNITTLATYSAPQTNYFSYTTGQYYSTYAAALAASGNNSSNVRTFSYYSSDYYYNGYYYSDPYYYYWLSKYGSSSSDSSSSSSDTTTATVGNKKGWTSVATYLGKLSSGSSVKVSMNTETTIPSSVTSAIKGKNVTVQFVLKNGTVFTINGKDISSAKDIDISTTYNTSKVPSKLVKAAYKKNDAVSSAQISISGDSFGAAADITVKFATKRAGYTAKLYRYNSSKNTLSLVDSAKIQSNGKCTFGEVTKGGDFVIVIC